MALLKLKAGLCAGAATAALGYALGAHAQGATPAAVPVVEAVTVTGSRLVSNGTQAPTPVTVLTMETIQSQAPLSLADGLKFLPQFVGSTTTTSNGINTDYGGNNYLALRNLGFERGLILLDGKRVVTTAATGGVDMNTLPEALVERTDIVTGGASAAYGSGAITGVVNLIINKKFNGVKVETDYNISSRNDNMGYKASIALGGPIADGRGHIVASYEYARSYGINQEPFTQNTKRPWINVATVRIGNPAVTAANPASVTNPQFILVPNARLNRANQYGVVYTGPLAFSQFNADGSLRPYDRGTNVSGTFSQGGDGWNWVNASPLDAPYLRENLFVHAEYDLSPNIQAYADILKSYNHAYVDVNPMYTHTTFTNGFPIAIDNAYLAPSVKAAMTAANVKSIGVNVIPQNTLDRKASETGGYTTQSTIGFTGKLFDRWTWDVFGSYAQNDGFVDYDNTVNLQKFVLATDAVVAPVGNAKAGQIVCRSTLTAPNNGCVPLNMLGNVVSTEAQKQWVQDDARYPSLSSQNLVEGSMSGKLFDLPAGPVAIAFGGQWREQELDRKSDSISKEVNPVTGFPTGAWMSGNLTEFHGKYTIKEYFGEVEIPLLKDVPLVQELSLNTAARRTDYSTSGVVNTWKIGLSYQPISDVRIRATKSRDIRAPNLFEIFSGPQQGIASVVDSTFTPAQSVSVTGYTGGGGSKLQPETGDTTTYGLVYRPSWLEGAYGSVDAYDITLKGAINGLSSQLTFDLCQAGNASLCANIVRDPVSKQITTVSSPLFNLSSIETSGFDIDAGYRFSLDKYVPVPGAIALRVLANKLDKFVSNTPGSAPVDTAGGGNLPHWRATFTANYIVGPATITWQTRMVGEEKFDATLTEVQLANNHVDRVFYSDLSGKYKFNVSGADMEAFAVMSNVFEPVPPNTPAVFNGAQTNRQLYEQIGRQFRFGLRAKF